MRRPRPPPRGRVPGQQAGSVWLRRAAPHQHGAPTARPRRSGQTTPRDLVVVDSQTPIRIVWLVSENPRPPPRSPQSEKSLDQGTALVVRENGGSPHRSGPLPGLGPGVPAVVAAQKSAVAGKVSPGGNGANCLPVAEMSTGLRAVKHRRTRGPRGTAALPVAQSSRKVTTRERGAPRRDRVPSCSNRRRPPHATPQPLFNGRLRPPWRGVGTSGAERRGLTICVCIWLTRRLAQVPAPGTTFATWCQVLRSSRASPAGRSAPRQGAPG